MPNSYTPFPHLILGIFISIIVFLILREFWCWYFKINKRIELLENILSELKKQNNNKQSKSEQSNKQNSKSQNLSEKKQNTTSKDSNSENYEVIENAEKDAEEDPYWNLRI